MVHARKNRARGFTLVELMVVVSIIGILASIAVVAYGRYLKAGKIQKLQQFALDVSAGEERFRSRNNAYYPAGMGGTITWATDKDDFINLLDFSGPVPGDITIEAETWASGGACGICEGLGADTTARGFAVRVTQDLNPGVAENTTVVLHNTLPSPVILYEGK